MPNVTQLRNGSTTLPLVTPWDVGERSLTHAHTHTLMDASMETDLLARETGQAKV